MIGKRNTGLLKLRRLFASFLTLSFLFFIACNTPIVDEAIVPKTNALGEYA